MKIIRLLPWLSLLMAGCQSEIPRESEVLAIVFDRPAGIWEERLPLGNGRLGACPTEALNRKTSSRTRYPSGQDPLQKTSGTQ